MKVLVTGATGLLGAECVRIFASQHTVSGLARRQSKIPQRGLKHFEACDITDRDAVRRVFDKLRPDAMIHTAAIADVDRCEREQQLADRVNVEGTWNVAEAAQSVGARIIAISTDYVFDGQTQRPYREQDPTGPVNVYGRTKLAAEKIVCGFTGNHLVIRTCWLFGSGGNSFIRKVLDDSKTQDKFCYVSDKVASPTHARDLAEALMKLCVQQEVRGIFHIANSGKASWYEYAKVILGSLDVSYDGRLKGISQSELSRYAVRPPMTALDNSRYCSVTGQALRTWQEALRECVTTMRAKHL